MSLLQNSQAEPWDVRIVASGASSPAPWVPSHRTMTALEHTRAGLVCDNAGYTLQFQVTAADLALASRAALARWARLYEQGSLPDWHLVSVNVSHSSTPATSDTSPDERPQATRRTSPQPDVVP